MADKFDWLTSFAEFDRGVEASATPFFTGLSHGSMTVELFRPVGTDTQTPHEQDELYIVHAGTSGFMRDGKRVSVSAGDVLFVPAGMDHRFVDFSEDFATWVVFWGPKGGEA
ncbi:cupin domain-containing protein [Erythrobacter sp. HA6-11]